MTPKLADLSGACPGKVSAPDGVHAFEPQSGRTDMNGLLRLIRRGGPKATVGTIIALAGFATAALVGVAIARTFTLQVAKNAKVINTTGAIRSENIVVSLRGRAIYDLTGDSKNHPKCTKAKGCFQFWPPVTVSSAKRLTKAPGVNGKLGVWHRNGFLQLTLAGHPLYTYAGDSQKHVATGEGIQSFGGTWHVLKASNTNRTGTATSTGTTTSTSTSTTTTATTTTSTTTTPCLYPPCY
jgi:predicted lipoprotein with Yx(FWY)xxD motif